MNDFTFVVIALLYLGLGILSLITTTVHEHYSMRTPEEWGILNLLYEIIITTIALLICAIIPFLNIILLIYSLFWPFTLLRYYLKSVRTPNFDKLMEKYHSEGIEAIFSADTSIRQKYNAIMRIDPYESNNQAVFEVMLKEIMDNKVEKYEPYLTAILSKIDSVKILKKAFIDDTRTDVEGKSSRRKAIIQRMQELIGIEADRFLLDIVGTETEPIMLFDYVDKRQAMREIREWAVKRDSNSDNDLSLVEYIDKHYKKKLR